MLLHTSFHLDRHANLEIRQHPNYSEVVPFGRCERRMIVGPKTRDQSCDITRRIESQRAAPISEQEPHHRCNSVLFESIEQRINATVGRYPAGVPSSYATEIPPYVTHGIEMMGRQVFSRIVESKSSFEVEPKSWPIIERLETNIVRMQTTLLRMLASAPRGNARRLIC